MTPATLPGTPRPTAEELGGQVLLVIADLPLFLTSPLFRRWHLRWGATAKEVAAALPGDELVRRAQFRCTRAISIDAAPTLVWPWLVQVGCLRAGFYSNDLLDNLGHPSARELVPDLQHLVLGQWIPMSPTTPSELNALRVDSYEVNQWLLWRKPDSTWVWQLTETEHGTTRLVTRVHASYRWSRPLSALLGVVLMEFGDFAMMRRMLRGIKERAETLAKDTTSPELLRTTSGRELASLEAATQQGDRDDAQHRQTRPDRQL